MRNKVEWGLIAGLAVAVLATSGVACRLGSKYARLNREHRQMLERVQTFEKDHGGDVFANLDKRQLDEKIKKQIAEEKAKAEKVKAAKTVPNVTKRADPPKTASQPPQMAVVSAMDSGNSICVRLSERPDMDVARDYISVEPLNSGRVSVKCFGYSWPYLDITGDFAFRTNVTLRIRKGLPLYGKGADPDAAGSLKEDFTYTFRRPDLKPSLKFADKGRYLPPAGRRAIDLEFVNITNITASIRRVEPRNIVQLLAREEREYRHVWSVAADSDATEELSGDAVECKFNCRTGKLNCRQKFSLPVTAEDGKNANGVFLVKAASDEVKHKYYWDDSWYVMRPIYRLVSVSDLGLSVRETHQKEQGDILVWVTSLTTGEPVKDVSIAVYSSANILVMEGTTGDDGLCRPERIDKGEPFAVVAFSAQDMNFMALRDSMQIDETYVDGKRPDRLKAGEFDAFIWTDRGIYRHGEKIFMQALVRNGGHRAPASMPFTLELLNPNDELYSTVTKVTDGEGSIVHADFSVPEDQPSGKWTLQVRLPGKSGTVIAEQTVKIEEFAPPQIRVAVEAADAEGGHPGGFGFTVKGEHLFGGPASGLKCEGAVVFEDVPFAPANWKGWQFGNETLGLKPSFRRLKKQVLNHEGSVGFKAPIWASSGLPKATVRSTAQGTVFEDGGRPATGRKCVIQHYYPYYIGAQLPSWIKLERGNSPSFPVVCVTPDGKRLTETKRLMMKIDRIDFVYSYRTNGNGWQTWDCERVKTTVCDNTEIVTSTNGEAKVVLPLDKPGDYVVTITDRATYASFGKSFYLSEWGDDVVRAPLANPTAVTIQPNKSCYRVGEVPRLTIKSPFAGFALLTVMRERESYSRVINLTNATSEVLLRAVGKQDAPNLDVYLSVVQKVGTNVNHLAVRAHGQTSIPIRPAEFEVPVAIEATLPDLHHVKAEVTAPGATYAIVTVVDEGINLLTGEKTPDPISWFARLRGSLHPYFDLYHRLLPISDAAALRVNGVKTGGGFGAEMLSRVSPTPTRRFKPLALWSERIDIKDGKGTAMIRIPDFVGEVRVTAVAYSSVAEGTASVQCKVAPKIVTMPDAPRFVAPGDTFETTLPIYNRSGADTRFAYQISVDGKAVAQGNGLSLRKDGCTNIIVRIVAPDRVGEMRLRSVVGGAGEVQDKTIDLPIRPAVAWEETAGVERISGDGKRPAREWPQDVRYAERVFDSPLGEYEAALKFLAEYPHGCLEQTASRMFPLIGAGGILNGIVTNAHDCVVEGVRRVESMIRSRDFVMWPDCDYAPWDREVSLYAAHFLLAAERSGCALKPSARLYVMDFLKEWSRSSDDNIAAYAVHNLALAGKPNKGRMLGIYDGATNLTLLARSRLAMAFVLAKDYPRARALLKNCAAPSSVKEAAFAMMALLELNPDDPRINSLLEYLNGARDRSRFSWGTTGENAHALLAIGEYFRRHPPQKGDKFLSWRKLTLPKPDEVTAVSNGIHISRNFLTVEGKPADLGDLRCGEMLVAELKLRVDDSRELSDLVVEDLFAGAMEPIHDNLPPMFGRALSTNELFATDWVMRSDARDDRMLVFSKKFKLENKDEACFRYPVRVVSAGDFVLPGPSVEGMYHPQLRARCVPARVVVRH